jgi:hypothetical protein
MSFLSGQSSSRRNEGTNHFSSRSNRANTQPGGPFPSLSRNVFAPSPFVRSVGALTAPRSGHCHRSRHFWKDSGGTLSRRDEGANHFVMHADRATTHRPARYRKSSRNVFVPSSFVTSVWSLTARLVPAASHDSCRNSGRSLSRRDEGTTIFLIAREPGEHAESGGVSPSR